MNRLLFLLLILYVLTGQSRAGDSTALEALVTGDDSRGWEAVGMLEMAGESFCTGALISERLVLTAAHCLFRKSTGEAYSPDEITFLAGWRNGRAEAYRGVRRAVAHGAYRADGEDRHDDLALIELDRPIRSTHIHPFATGALAGASRAVGVVSYAEGRAERPALQNLCHVLGKARGSLVLDCDIDHGSSGAPVFDLSGPTPVIVSVISAKAFAGKRPVALGTGLEAPLADLKAALAGSDGVFGRVRATSGALAQGTRIAAGGAKFLRP
ncbi:MAG: S1 family peptidase [Alphaproteobacteria bacterium]|nr:MAG: S1 family peptidase [Alphaproteobacteria bacterium]